MIHTTQPNGIRCGGTLIPRGSAVPLGDKAFPAGELRRCPDCGLVGVPYIPPKTRSRPGESLSDPVRAASVLSRDRLPRSIQVSNRSHKVIRR